ncbi:MAG TPA: CapA family protein, partial [Alphaproteobacteria bacterium]|nr:CapA family protein [Alphaproteobacteria bacterium]
MLTQPAPTRTYLGAAADKSPADYYKQAQTLATAAGPATSTLTFLAVGDIMLSRGVAAQITKEQNVNWPFLRVQDLLRQASFNFGNLESPAAPSGTPPVIGGHSLIFGAPPEDLQGLAQANFQVLNLANNHAFDQGLAGLKATRMDLDQLSLAHMGTGNTTAQAWQPARFSAGGLTVCFIGASYASVNDGGGATNPYVARIEDTANLAAAIAQAKETCSFVVATMHAGTEYARLPNAAQTAFAHAAIDAGADLVIGAHPHWIQPIEQYRGKYIFYSLGNFVFDQSWSQDTREGLALKIQ